jgi:Fic/DOC family
MKGLPIFSNNMRSSASWADLLERERQSWTETLSSADSRAAVEACLLELQAGQEQARVGGIDAQRFIAAARFIRACTGKSEAKLTVESLLQLQRVLTGASDDLLRQSEALPITALHDPAPARILPRMLDNAFDWFTTEGFNQLHPLEQATVVYLRLLDLAPFNLHSDTTALLAAGFYTVRADLPPMIIYADDETLASHTNALEAAFRMLTQPLVELFAEMLARTMRLCSGIEK